MRAVNLEFGFLEKQKSQSHFNLENQSDGNLKKNDGNLEFILENGNLKESGAKPRPVVGNLVGNFQPNVTLTEPDLT